MTTPARYKRSVRNYLIDSRFQLKYTGFMVAVTLVISGVLVYALYKTSKEVVVESEALVDESRKVSDVSRMNIKDLAGDSPELMADFNKESLAHDKAIEDQQRALVQRQKTLLYTIGGGLAAMVVLIGLLGIYVTHKVAGPIFKMKRLLKEVGDGKLGFDQRLRKGDELQDFFEAFLAMVDKLRERNKREIGELDLAIDAAKKGGVREEAVAKVKDVRDELQRALEG